MIDFSALDQAITPRIDEEGTDAHDLVLDRIPAVNAAQRLVQSAITGLLEAKKFSGEALRDLNWTAVFQTSVHGQVEIDDILQAVPDPDNPGQVRAHRLWSVIGVYPEFHGIGPQTMVPDPVQTRSMLRPDVRFLRPVKSAARLTQQQWDGINQDIFAPGSPLMTNPKLKTYGYLLGTRPLSATGPITRTLLSVTGIPPGTRKQVAVSYLKAPDMVPSMPGGTSDPLYASTRLEWPESMMELLVAVSCRMVVMKQGDGTTLNSLSQEEAGMLIQTLM